MPTRAASTSSRRASRAHVDHRRARRRAVKAGSPIATSMPASSPARHRLRPARAPRDGTRPDGGHLAHGGGIQQTYGRARSTSPRREPGAHGLRAHPHRALPGLPTADGWINVGGANQSNWERIAGPWARGSPGRPALRHERRAHEALAELTPLIAERMKAQPSAHWIRELERPGAGRAHQPHRDMLATRRWPRATWWWRSTTRRRAHQGPGHAGQVLGHALLGHSRGPLLGQHTREILGTLGYSPAEIDALASKGAVEIAS